MNKLALITLLGFYSVCNCYAAPNAAPEAKKSGIIDEKAFDSSFTNQPTNISSDSLTLRQDEKVFVYDGNVKVVQGDMTLTSKTLEGTYDENNKIKRLIARGEVVINKADIAATSQQALYDAATSTVTLIENPQVKQNDSILTADRIRIFLNDNRSEAEGQVRVTLANKDSKPTAASAAQAAAALITPTVAPTPKP